MRPVPAPAFLRTLRLLLPLAACGWAPAVASPIRSNRDELVHLYTSNLLKNFYLQIHPDGRVDSSPSQTVHSALKIKALRAGYVTIKGKKSGLFLCMRSNGRLFGSRSFSNDNCVFKHTMLENHHDVYESVRRNLLVSLGNVKGPFVPSGDLPPFSQFLTRENEIPSSEFNPPVPREEDTRDKGFPPCLGINVGGTWEDGVGEDETDPCMNQG